MQTNSNLLKISSILWVIWGIVHIFAGGMVMNFVIGGNPTGGFSGIADAVDPESLQMAYPDAVGAILGQHGFNLFWIGLVALISAFFIWRGNTNAIFLAAIAGGLADLGYFFFLDLGGYVNFVPGTVMTLVSASAIVLSFVAYFRNRRSALNFRS